MFNLSFFLKIISFTLIVIAFLTGCATVYEHLDDAQQRVEARRLQLREQYNELYAEYYNSKTVVFHIKEIIEENWEHLPEDLQRQLVKLWDLAVEMDDKLSEIDEELREADSDLEKLQERIEEVRKAQGNLVERILSVIDKIGDII